MSSSACISSKTSHSRQKLRRRILPALALIMLGQLNLLAHLYDSVNENHSGECLVCVQLQAQGHGLISSDILPLSPVPDNFSTILHLADPATAFHGLPGARAPPATQPA